LRDLLVEEAWLRIVVPDGELYCRKYIQSLETGVNAMPFASDIEFSHFKTPIMSLNVVMRHHDHLFIYDFATLEIILKALGYRQVQKLDYKIGNDPVLLKDSENRKIESLYVECQK